MTAAQATDVIVVLITTITIVASVLALAVLRDIRFRAWFRDRLTIRELRRKVTALEAKVVKLEHAHGSACQRAALWETACWQARQESDQANGPAGWAQGCVRRTAGRKTGGAS